MNKLEHFDITTMKNKEGNEQDVVLFNTRPHHSLDELIEYTKELIKEIGYGSEFQNPTKKDIRLVFIKENPLFKENPGEEDAYFYTNQGDSGGWPMLEVTLPYKNE